jgi:hypothetical protein
MTDQKKKPEDDEVSDEQLEEVAGRTLQETFLKDIKETKAVLEVQKEAIGNLRDAVRDMVDIQKTTFESTKTIR